jgi:hypothetical protein
VESRVGRPHIAVNPKPLTLDPTAFVQGMVESSLRVHVSPLGNSMPLPFHVPVTFSPLPSLESKSMKMVASSLEILPLIVHGFISTKGS